MTHARRRTPDGMEAARLLYGGPTHNPPAPAGQLRLAFPPRRVRWPRHLAGRCRIYPLIPPALPRHQRRRRRRGGGQR